VDSNNSNPSTDIEGPSSYLKNYDIFIFEGRPKETAPFISVNRESNVNEMILYIKTSLFSGKEVLLLKDVQFLNTIKKEHLKGCSYSFENPNSIYLSLGTKSRMFTHFEEEIATFESLRTAIKCLLLN
jgi:hypothetical protein